jgi:uncharacterized protein YggU (UPF0235/DUF167 family)
VIVTVASVLKVPKSSVELVKGHKDRGKVVSVLDETEVQAKLDALKDD